MQNHNYQTPMMDNSIDFGARFCRPPTTTDCGSLQQKTSKAGHLFKLPTNYDVLAGLGIFKSNENPSSQNGSMAANCSSSNRNLNSNSNKKSSSFPFNPSFLMEPNASSTPIPIDGPKDGAKTAFSFPGDGKLELSGSGSFGSSPLTSSGNYSGITPVQPRTTMRAIRAASCNLSSNRQAYNREEEVLNSESSNLSARFGGSGSTGKGSRSSSPSDSESSGISSVPENCLTNWISNLHLGTSVAGPNVTNRLTTSKNHLASNVMAPLASSTVSHALSSYQVHEHQRAGPPPPPPPTHVPAMPIMSTFFGDRRWQSPSFLCGGFDPFGDSVERAAKLHRTAASYSEAKCTWSGQLPVRVHKNPNYSCKVFLGGSPWDITEAGLMEAFSQFGPVKVQWPKEQKNNGSTAATAASNPSQKAGYVYIIFEMDKQVKLLLQNCTHDYSNGGRYYHNISSRRMRCKEVQIIPWILGDSNFVRCPSQRLDPSKTVFVGALHGMLTAEGLAHIMNDLFGGVVYVGIDTDKYKYPMGSARVTFSNTKSYMKAVSAGFVDIKCSRFSKKIQLDPYMENAMCSTCNMQQGPIFCRDLACFRYFCRNCWQWMHSIDQMRNHHPLMRIRRDN